MYKYLTQHNFLVLNIFDSSYILLVVNCYSSSSSSWSFECLFQMVQSLEAMTER